MPDDVLRQRQVAVHEHEANRGLRSANSSYNMSASPNSTTAFSLFVSLSRFRRAGLASFSGAGFFVAAFSSGLAVREGVLNLPVRRMASGYSVPEV